MIITEDIIRRIARQVFNVMFQSALRQSNVGGTVTDVQHAVEADHATAADSVPWTGVSGKPSFATVATSGSYNDLSNKPSIPSVSGSVSGSTLTITINGSNYSLTDTNTWRGIQNNLTSNGNTTESLSAHQGYLLANGSARDDSKLLLAGGTITGNLTVEQTFTCQSVEIGHTNEINATGSNNLYLQYRNSGNLVLCYNGHNVGIGTDSPSYKLHVAGKIYSTGGFAFLSDKRMKNVIDRQVQLTVDQIANAPLIYYTLKGDKDKRVQLGSVAQYWKTVLPETVQTDEAGTLSMQYDVQAHTAVVVLARKVSALWEEVEKIKKQSNG